MSLFRDVMLKFFFTTGNWSLRDKNRYETGCWWIWSISAFATLLRSMLLVLLSGWTATALTLRFWKEARVFVAGPSVQHAITVAVSDSMKCSIPQRMPLLYGVHTGMLLPGPHRMPYSGDHNIFGSVSCCPEWPTRWSFVRFIRGGGWLLAVFRRAFSYRQRWGLDMAQCAIPL